MVFLSHPPSTKNFDQSCSFKQEVRSIPPTAVKTFWPMPLTLTVRLINSTPLMESLIFFESLISLSCSSRGFEQYHPLQQSFSNTPLSSKLIWLSLLFKCFSGRKSHKILSVFFLLKPNLSHKLFRACSSKKVWLINPTHPAEPLTGPTSFSWMLAHSLPC